MSSFFQTRTERTVKKIFRVMWTLQLIAVLLAYRGVVCQNNNPCSQVESVFKKLPQYLIDECLDDDFYGVAGGSNNLLVANTVEKIQDILPEISDASVEKCLEDICDTRQTNCPLQDEYATYDGTCNNRNNPIWGSVGEEQRREIAALFDGNFNSARLNDRHGNPLPDVRTISNELFKDETDDGEDSKFTLWVMAFSQMADHDMTLTPMMKDIEGKAINCCDEKYSECQKICLNISTSDRDPHFGKNGDSGVRQKCINFVRSAPAPSCDENYVRTPTNAISAYLDGNPTYGNSEEEAAFFRDNKGKGAKLKVGPFTNEGQYLQPHPDQSKASCLDGGKVASGPTAQYCYISGDIRHHVVPSLAALITMFMREHNRVVDKLQTLGNTGWTDERYYQEARKIVMAEYQMFTIRDLTADVTLDDATAAKYNLFEADGYDNVYDETINAQVSAQFSTASYRFGHSLVNKLHGRYNKENDQETLSEKLHDNFNRVQTNFRESGLNGVLRFIGNKGMKPANGQLSATVRDLLFLDNGTKLSLDLASLNIMRGRDHGLADYNSWRRFCGLQPFPASHTSKITRKIRKIYDNRDDEIDLFSGAMTEDKLSSALVGELFACLIGEQFHRFKYGDRFYYQNSPDATTSKGRFKTVAQVKSLQKMTLARVLCENTETEQIQPDVFRRVSETNPLTPCSDFTKMPDIDFNEWKE